MINEKLFIMLVGLPGSGKSTFVNNFLTSMSIVCPNTQIFVASSDNRVDAAKESGETYQQAFTRLSNSGRLNEMEQEMFQDVSKFVSKNDYYVLRGNPQAIVLWDQTNLNRKTRAKKLAFATDSWTKIALYFPTHKIDLEKRLLDRAERIQKVIPNSVVENMRKSFEYPSIEEGFNYVLEVDNG